MKHCQWEQFWRMGADKPKWPLQQHKHYVYRYFSTLHPDTERTSNLATVVPTKLWNSQKCICAWWGVLVLVEVNDNCCCWWLFKSVRRLVCKKPLRYSCCERCSTIVHTHSSWTIIESPSVCPSHHLPCHVCSTFWTKCSAPYKGFKILHKILFYFVPRGGVFIVFIVEF